MATTVQFQKQAVQHKDTMEFTAIQTTTTQTVTTTTTIRALNKVVTPMAHPKGVVIPSSLEWAWAASKDELSQQTNSIPLPFPFFSISSNLSRASLSHQTKVAHKPCFELQFLGVNSFYRGWRVSCEVTLLDFLLFRLPHLYALLDFLCR